MLPYVLNLVQRTSGPMGLDYWIPVHPCNVAVVHSSELWAKEQLKTVTTCWDKHASST